MHIIVKYLNDDTKYNIYSFDKIRDNCIYLNCDYNKLTSLEPIKNLTQLQKLYCSYNQLTSLEPIRNLIQLKIL